MTVTLDDVACLLHPYRREDDNSKVDLTWYGCPTDDWLAWCWRGRCDRLVCEIFWYFCNYSMVEREYMKNTSIGKLIWIMVLGGRMREIIVGNGVWGISCYIWSNGPYSLIRATSTLNSFFLCLCRILTHFMSSNGLRYHWKRANNS